MPSMGLAGLANMEGTAGSFSRRRRATMYRSQGSRWHTSNGRRDQKARHDSAPNRSSIFETFNENKQVVSRKLSKLKSVAQTLLRNSKVERKRIKEILVNCQDERVVKELRNWPLTVDCKGRICVHGFRGNVVNLRGAKALPPLCIFGADLDLQHSTELESIEDLFVEGRLDLRGCKSLQQLPEDLVAFDLLLGGCADLVALPEMLRIQNDIDLSGCYRLNKLPGTLKTVNGSLHLDYCTSIKELPQELSVGHSLSLVGCSALSSLPRSRLYVGSDLIMDNCINIKTISTADFDVEQVISLKYCTSLTCLPQNLIASRLDLSGCTELVSLPASLKVLADLDLCECTSLINLPDELDVGGSLDMSGCIEVVNLPPLLRVGGDLFLRGCTSLEEIPPGISVGGDLHLENCTSLYQLPEELFQWGCSSDPLWYGSTRNVYLAGAGLPASELERIRNAEAPGMQFYVSIDEQAQIVERFTSLKDALQAWHCTLPVHEYIGRAYQRGILLFLSHLRISKEYEDEDMRPGLEDRVNEILELICSDPVSRDDIISRMNDSVDACGDKPIWALNQMTLISRVARARNNEEHLRLVGLGVMRLGIVHKHVRRKIDSLGFIDDVCVYLAFEIALREELDLPVSATAMKFPNYIKIDDQELSDALEEALGISEAEFQEWLENWPEWHRFQRSKSAPAYANIEECEFRDDLSLFTDINGEPILDPVLVGGAVWSYEDLLPHWIHTGMDLNNTPWPTEKFLQSLKRVAPTQPRTSSRVSLSTRFSNSSKRHSGTSQKTSA